MTGTGFGDSRANVTELRIFVFALFFIFGGITSLNDVIIPKLKDLFTLSYAQAMLVQSAFFAAYFLISIPGAEIVRRVGYMRTAIIGLLTMTAGCLLFVPAASSSQFGIFLLALFVLASGITIVQVVANPLISMLGNPATAHSRLTFAQAFNSLGTTVFPYVGSILILGGLATVDPQTLSGAALDQFRSQESRVIVNTYLGLAAALCVVAVLVWLHRNRLVEAPVERTPIAHMFNLLKRPRFGMGAMCIFLYVGAEVAIGSMIVNYLMQTNVLAMGAEDAGKHVTYYWGGAMVGRFIGAYLLRVVFARQGAGRRRQHGDRPADRFREQHRCGLGMVAAGDRIIQLHHVPDDLLAGVRGVGRACGRRVGDHLRRHRRRGDRAADHRRSRRPHRFEIRARGTCPVLRRYTGLWNLRTPTRTLGLNPMAIVPQASAAGLFAPRRFSR